MDFNQSTPNGKFNNNNKTLILIISILNTKKLWILIRLNEMCNIHNLGVNK